jgi:predicted ArsR family transcriptional regulator
MNDVSLDKIGLLAEPVRRSVYAFVASAHGAVDRDAVAAGVGIGRPLAAFHLDRLVAGGLLGVEYHRRSGRTGPGAGRPAKFYRRVADIDVEVSLPPRQYGLAAEILATGIDMTTTPKARAQVLEAARERGRALAADGGDLLDVLATNGYEPLPTADGGVRLGNCPFHALVDEHRELTCSMNLALLDSVTSTIEDSGFTAVAQPEPGYCCVALVPRVPLATRAQR